MYEINLYRTRDGIDELVRSFRTQVESFTEIMMQQALDYALQLAAENHGKYYIINNEGQRRNL